MDTSNLGKWAWLIGLIILVVMGLLGGLGVNLGLDIVGQIAVALAFLGGVLSLAGMSNRTDFLIAAAALGWFAGGAGPLFVDMVGGVISGILGGAGLAASAGAAGILLVMVYEWVMSAMK